MSIEEDLGFIVEEDQSDRELPSTLDWQSEYNRCIRRGWLQGHRAQVNFPDMTVESNPYIGRGEALEIITLALGWEDGYLAAGLGVSEEDCPHPEA